MNTKWCVSFVWHGWTLPDSVRLLCRNSRIDIAWVGVTRLVSMLLPTGYLGDHSGWITNC